MVEKTSNQTPTAGGIQKTQSNQTRGCPCPEKGEEDQKKKIKTLKNEFRRKLR
jgi:hypothetical protein